MQALSPRTNPLRNVLRWIMPILAISLGAPARAVPPDACQPGPVQAMFTAFIPGVDQLLFRGQRDGLGGVVQHCQFRLFWAYRTFCFSEDDYFLGAVNFLTPLESQNVPEAWNFYEIADDLESISIAVELWKYPQSGAPPESQPTVEWLDVQTTPVHAGRRFDMGAIVYQHHGVLLSLPPGDYAFVTHSYYPGDAADPPWPGCDVEGNCAWDPVFVRVFTSEDAEILGPSSGFGTVECPAD